MYYLLNYSTGAFTPTATAGANATSNDGVGNAEKSKLMASNVASRAKVLYDYDAANSAELSLLADEIITVHTVPGMDDDWIMAERGNQRGKVPTTYIQILS